MRTQRFTQLVWTEKLSSQQARAGCPLDPLRQTYDAALISVTWIVLVALS